MRLIVICVLILSGLIASVDARDREGTTLQYPEFVDLVSQYNIQHVHIVRDGPGRIFVVGQLPEDYADNDAGAFRVELAEFNEAIETLLKDSGVNYTIIEQSSSGIRNISAAIPIVLMGLYIAFIVFVVVLAVRLVRAAERIAANTEK